MDICIFMDSGKNSSLKYCIKCSILLTDINWTLHDRKSSHYCCKECRKQQNNINRNNDIKYNDKQLARFRMRKSAVIFSYGNKCTLCYEDDYDKLLIDKISKKKRINIYDYLYNNVINKDEYQVLCYNCSCSKNTIYKDKYVLRDKNKVINNYGGYCIKCKEGRIERLIITNKNNDDTKLICRHNGSKMYRWLIKNNYPSNLELQILCFNCNQSSKNKKTLQLDGI